MASVTNSRIRSRAQDVVNLNLSRIIMLHLAVWAIPLAILCLRLPDMLASLYNLLINLAQSETLTEMDTYATSTAAQMLVSHLQVFLPAALVCMVLNTGFMRGMQQLGRGEMPGGSVVISRWRHALGAIGLCLWIGVKTFFWALPANLLLNLALVLEAEGVAASGLIEFVGNVLYIALVVPASLRYAMSAHIFADTPEIGVFDAVESSKRMMAHRKWQLFCLTLPYELGMVGVWVLYFCILLVIMLVSGSAVNTFIGWLIIVLMLAAIAATIYLGFLATVAIACYYNAHKPQPEAEAPTAAQAPAAAEAQPVTQVAQPAAAALPEDAPSAE